MKKNLRKLFAILMTVAVVLSMAMPVLAEDGGAVSYTLTINANVEAGGGYDSKLIYDVYQLFTVNFDDNDVPSYTVNSAMASILGDETVDSIAGGGETGLWNLARTLHTNGATTELHATTGEALTLEGGYYLAVPTGKAGKAENDLSGGTVSGPIFVAVPGVKQLDNGKFELTNNVVATAKESKVTTDKAITDIESVHGTDDTYTSNTATLGEGDTIEYTITNIVPSYTKDVIEENVTYYVVDNYDGNLALESVSVTTPVGLNPGSGVDKEGHSYVGMDGITHVVPIVQNGDYYVERNDDAYTFTVYFNYNKIKPIEAASASVVITAKFKLNGTAVPGKDIPNKSTLTYTNNYYNGATEDLSDEVHSWTFKFDAVKYDTKTNEPLPGAVFELYETQADGSIGSYITEATSADETGLIDFGLDLNAGTYIVKEKEAPNGYRVDETEYKVVIEPVKTGDGNEYTENCTITVYAGADDEHGTVITDEFTNGKFTYKSDNEHIKVLGIGNTPGTTLPGTGGIGTTIFTFGGLALIVLAGILLVVYTRKQKKAKA